MADLLGERVAFAVFGVAGTAIFYDGQKDMLPNLERRRLLRAADGRNNKVANSSAFLQ